MTAASKTCRLSRLSKEAKGPPVWISIIFTEGIAGKLHTTVIVMTGFQISLLIETCVMSHKATSAWHQDIKQASGKGMSKVVSTCIFLWFPERLGIQWHHDTERKGNIRKGFCNGHLSIWSFQPESHLTEHNGQKVVILATQVTAIIRLQSPCPFPQPFRLYAARIKSAL